MATLHRECEIIKRSPSPPPIPTLERAWEIGKEEGLEFVHKGNERSVREFTREALTERELSQLLWAALGITRPEGLRTAPSAGALFPLELARRAVGRP
jgi:hypothetical protein